MTTRGKNDPASPPEAHDLDNSRKTVLFVGTIPPPIGGVSVHVLRLMTLAARRGWNVRLLDLHPVRGKNSPGPCLPATFKRRAVAVLLLWRMLLTGRETVIHYHASRLRTFLALNLPVVFARRSGCRILTLHSGDVTRDLGRLGALSRLTLRRVLRRYDIVISVGKAIATAIEPYLDAGCRSLTIPAFIAPPDRTAADRSPHPAADVNGQAVPTIVCSGYGTPLYNWDEVLTAIDECPASWRWTCCFYTTFERPYYDRIRQELDRRSNVAYLENLAPEAFLTVLSGGAVFLRPTRTDGDAVSVREAIAMGVPCVASDVVERPSEVILYRLGDKAGLRESLLTAVGQCAGPRPGGRDFGQSVIDLYESALPASRVPDAG